MTEEYTTITSTSVLYPTPPLVGKLRKIREVYPTVWFAHAKGGGALRAPS